MPEELIFSKIQNDTIFVKDYINFEKNNKITFSNEGIAVLYGPNGTGKTSLVKVLAGEKGTDVSYRYEDLDYTDNSQFYVINDQNNRNIIAGTAKDFLLGDDIKKEFELHDYLGKEYFRLCSENITVLKETYGISSSSSKSIECFKNNVEVLALVKDLMNNRSKGDKTGINAYITTMEKQDCADIKEFEQEKLDFLIRELSKKASILDNIESLEIKEIVANSHIKEVEENSEAIRVLEHFGYKNQCIVCDTQDIDTASLLEKKIQNRNNIINSLDKKTKEIVEKIIAEVDGADPFKIKKTMMDAVETGALDGVILMKDSIQQYKSIFAQRAIYDLLKIYRNSDIKERYHEYEKMVSDKPEISEEDFIYIEQIIKSSMNKDIQVIRDDKKNIKILLEKKEFLGVDRDELPLSSGEQNFLSLTFELLKAKQSNKPIIILDDPISSFDSIYKNKIAYAIIRVLRHKKRIILTHNVDLLRLLNAQYTGSFKLFLFNNTDNEENGFIPLKAKERDMLINLEKLLLELRNEIYSHIKDVNLFLISMIPFMRGYATIVNKNDIKDSLTQLMHGYKTDRVDVAKAYITLFGDDSGKLSADIDNVIPPEYVIDVNEILSVSLEGKEIVDKNIYPLLNRTLLHSLSYLFLRLLIEKKLTEKFPTIDTGVHKQLGNIIAQAFPENGDKDDIRKRVMLTSKKTLLNEFNHFEGNMSIFQPAIDITDQMLEKEKGEIISFVNTL